MFFVVMCRFSVLLLEIRKKFRRRQIMLYRYLLAVCVLSPLAERVQCVT